MEIKLDEKNFESEVLKSDIPVLVDFWAEWCGPCHAIAPVLSELAKEYEGRMKLGKLNVDENTQTAQAYQISSIPNMKLFKNGKIVDEFVGVMPKDQIADRLDKAL